MAVINKVQLITYPDSLGGDLKSLNVILQKYFADIFEGGIHILPPFPSSGDRGFAPLTYLEIEPTFGTWEDIKAISKNFNLALDLMINHISKQSSYFQDFLEKGKKSRYADLFIPLDKIWKDGKPVQEDIDKIFLRRNKPFSTFNIKETGESETLWTTFGKQDPSEQIDLDIHSSETKKLFTEFMVNFSKQGVKLVRLDAVGYVIKKKGTSCFFVEPEIYQFLNWIKELADSLGIELLPEVHSHYNIQYKLSENGFWIYDFILPFYILESLINKSCSRLTSYIMTRPYKQFTMLDCHDGVPVKPDLDDLVNTKDAQKIVDVCMERGSNLSLIFSDKHKSGDGFDVHQIRCSYYSVLNCNDDAYIAARAIQFFTPGIPQVYYVGLLAGENDFERVEKIGEGREVNRHNYSLEEIDEALKKPVVKRLINLIRFRNQYPAFNGSFNVDQKSDNILNLSWQKEKYNCQLKVDFNNLKTEIYYTNEEGKIKLENI